MTPSLRKSLHHSPKSMSTMLLAPPIAPTPRPKESPGCFSLQLPVYLMQKELQYLGSALANPERPFVAILGGAKVSDKITVIEKLLSKVDSILIGGGMAYTFLESPRNRGRSIIGRRGSHCPAADLLKMAKEKKVEFLLPTDHVVAEAFAPDSPSKIARNADFPAVGMGLDIGPETIKLYAEKISTAKTVVWNGPMGVFEFDAFAKGTFAVAEALAAADCLSIIGGGDSVAAVNKSNLQDKMTHISTGGGASLEFLEGKALPELLPSPTNKDRRTSCADHFIAGNWKLHKTLAESRDLAQQLFVGTADVKDRDIVIAPVFTALAAVTQIVGDTHIGLAAQNCYPADRGHLPEKSPRPCSKTPAAAMSSSATPNGASCLPKPMSSSIRKSTNASKSV